MTESLKPFVALTTIQVLPADRTVTNPLSVTVAICGSRERNRSDTVRRIRWKREVRGLTANDEVSPTAATSLFSETALRAPIQLDAPTFPNTGSELSGPNESVAHALKTHPSANASTGEGRPRMSFSFIGVFGDPADMTRLRSETSRSPVALRPRLSPGLPLSLPPEAVYDPAAVRTVPSRQRKCASSGDL